MGRSGTFCNWRVIVYPESLKENWKIILKNMCIQCAISPLHQFDVWTEDDPHYDPEMYVVGELKKPHYHLVLHWGGSKSFESVRNCLAVINQDDKPPHIIPVYGEIGEAVKYLVHQSGGCGDKFKYDRDDIEALNGFDVDRFFKLTKEQEEDLTSSIRHFIRDKKIFEYSDLLDILGDIDQSNDLYSDFHEMYVYCYKHTIWCNSYLRSHKFRNMPKADDQSADVQSADE